MVLWCNLSRPKLTHPSSWQGSLLYSFHIYMYISFTFFQIPPHLNFVGPHRKRMSPNLLYFRKLFACVNFKEVGWAVFLRLTSWWCNDRWSNWPLFFFFFLSYPRGIMRRAPTVGGTFKPVLQLRLEVPAWTERHRFSQQMRLPCDSNWGANPVKPLKGTLLPVEPTLCWWPLFILLYLLMISFPSVTSLI